MKIKNLKEIDLKYTILTPINFIIMMSFPIHKILQSRQKIESKNEILDNVIRIETQDGSGAFIDKSNNLPTIDIHNKELKAQRKIHIDIHQNKGGI